MESEIKQIENACTDITLLAQIALYNITFV